MEKSIPQENLYNITYMVTDKGERQEYALFVHGFNEMSAVVDGVSGIYNSKLGFENVAFKSISLGTLAALLNKQILCCPASGTADPVDVKSCS